MRNDSYAFWVPICLRIESSCGDTLAHRERQTLVWCNFLIWSLEPRVGMPPRIGPGLFSLDPDPAGKKYFEDIFRVKDFTNVTPASEGETRVGAHKMVLISASHKKIQQKI